MSPSSEALTGTYLAELLSLFPTYKPSDFFAVVCCGDNLNEPYDGWHGIVAVPVFDEGVSSFSLFFGDFPDSLAEYENLASFRISGDVTKYRAFSEFRQYVGGISDSPVFISSNADTWLGKILKGATLDDPEGPWNYQCVCLRQLYGTTSKHEPLFRTSYIGQLLRNARPLPKTFGLHKMAESLGIVVPCTADKVTHRAKLTAEVAKKCLLKDYPS